MKRLVRFHCMKNLVIFSEFFTIRTVLYVMCAYVQAKRSMTEKMFGKVSRFCTCGNVKKYWA